MSYVRYTVYFRPTAHAGVRPVTFTVAGLEPSTVWSLRGALSIPAP